MKTKLAEPSQLEILKCLTAINYQRWEEEEVKGLHKKGKK